MADIETYVFVCLMGILAALVAVFCLCVCWLSVKAFWRKGSEQVAPQASGPTPVYVVDFC